ncbi:hypothetical protein [Bartonella sp. CB178]|uniref:hypothetical protein n=1 Tax=Bartonella sp. CB178 TaxID=3112255 RepID=UPI00300E2EEB
MDNYIRTHNYILYSEIKERKFSLSSSQFKKFNLENKNFLYVRDFLDRDLQNKDLGTEIGSVNYIERSTHYFLKTKALQEHSFLPEFSPESTIPILPKSFLNMNLKEGDLIISKDGNIGESIILDKDYHNIMLSGALYRLPITKNKYYLFAFIKNPIFKEQLDFMVPKGATIRHAKTLFLNCKIPIPNNNKNDSMKFIEFLTKAILKKESLIRTRHDKILEKIETELLENQNQKQYSFELPTIKEIEHFGRLDTSLYGHPFKYWNFIVNNYKYGSIDLPSRGFTWERGTSLEKGCIGIRIDSNIYHEGFYELVLPTNISQYGYVKKISYIGTPTKLKTIEKGDIIFGGEGFGKGRTYVVLDKSSNVVTNYHGIRLINQNANLIESIFIRCFLAFWRSKGMIDYIGVGGSGGHCAPSYFHLINTPKFSDIKQREISKLYYNSNIEYLSDNFTLDNFLENDDAYNDKAGIYELDKTAKYLKKLLNIAIDDIANDRDVVIRF